MSEVEVLAVIVRDDSGQPLGLVSESGRITVVSDFPDGMDEERVQFVAAVTEEQVRELIRRGTAADDHLEIRQSWKRDFPMDLTP